MRFLPFVTLCVFCILFFFFQFKGFVSVDFHVFFLGCCEWRWMAHRTDSDDLSYYCCILFLSGCCWVVIFAKNILKLNVRGYCQGIR